MTTPAASPITSGPFGTVTTFIGNFVSAYSALGPYAVSRATTGAGVGLAEIPRGAIAPGSGRLVALADANAFSNDLGFISDGRNQALLRKIVAACR